jgi:hypothetical protein
MFLKTFTDLMFSAVTVKISISLDEILYSLASPDFY